MSAAPHMQESLSIWLELPSSQIPLTEGTKQLFNSPNSIVLSQSGAVGTVLLLMPHSVMAL